MSQNKPDLSPSQQRLLEYLLQGESISSAAELAKVARSTATRWLASEPFKAAYTAAQNEAFAATLKTLQGVSAEAVASLRKILADEEVPPAAKVSAIRCALEFALKSREQGELEERIEKLEAQFAQRG